MQTQEYDDVYALQPHFIEVYEHKSVDKLCHVSEKNSALKKNPLHYQHEYLRWMN